MKNSTNSLWRPYGAHQLKAAYQKHMLLGLLGASLIMLIPTAVFVLVWSPPEPVIGRPTIIERQISIVSEMRDFDRNSVTSDRPPAPRPPSPNQTTQGSEFVPVADKYFEGPDIDFTNEYPGGVPGGEGEPIDIFEPLLLRGSGGGGETFPDIDSFVVIDQIPIIVTSVKPEYPRLAKQAGLEGTVHLRALIDKTGRVRDVRVMVSSMTRTLDEAAVAAGWKNTYRPAIRGKEPVAVWVSYRVKFTLE